MTTYNAPGLVSGIQNRDRVMAHVYGNLAVKRAKVSIPVGAVATDIVNFFVLPADCEIIDFFAVNDGANSAATTMNIGLKYATPAAPSTDQSDADYFLAAYDINAAGRTRWGNTAVYSLTTNAEYFVQGVLAGATVATAAAVVEVTVMYVFNGNL